MKAMTPIDAYFALLVIALSLHCSYGAGGIDANCTSSSDCVYDHGQCHKAEQCEIGACACADGYSQASSQLGGLCRKLRKLGERCDVIYDQCYDGTCKGVCECAMGLHASEDGKTCVGNAYGESCRSRVYDNPNWSYAKCDNEKQLTCDPTTYRCKCKIGTKRVGDHCEFYRSGEECDNTQRCLTHLVCHSDTRTCGCAPGKKELTVTSKNEKSGIDVFSHRCIDDAAITGVALMGECNNNYDRSGGKICGDYLQCDTCREWANSRRSNTKCLSGAAAFSTNIMTLVGLLAMSLVVKFE